MDWTVGCQIMCNVYCWREGYTVQLTGNGEVQVEGYGLVAANVGSTALLAQRTERPK